MLFMKQTLTCGSSSFFKSTLYIIPGIKNDLN